MSYCIKDKDAEQAARLLAEATGQSIAAAIRRACQNALAAERSRRPFAERLRPIVRELEEKRRDHQPWS